MGKRGRRDQERDRREAADIRRERRVEKGRGRKEGGRGRGGQTGPWRASVSRAPRPVLPIRSWWRCLSPSLTEGSS